MWECIACLVTLVLWAPPNLGPFTVLGDNIGALTTLPKLKGKRDYLAVAREIAWRQAAFRWQPVPAHKPSELNTLSDALSRLHAPVGSERRSFPPALKAVLHTPGPDLDSLWKAWAPAPLYTCPKARQRKRGPASL